MKLFDLKQLRDAQPVWAHETSIRFQDVDAAGVVFFARFFDFFHDAWLAFIEHGGLQYPEIVNARSWGAPLKHVEADYFAPLRFGDRIAVGLVEAAWEGSNLLIGYQVTSGGKVAAVGMTQHVVIDIQGMKRIDPPEAFRAIFQPLVRAQTAG